MMIAKATGPVAIPDAWDSNEAAPLLCAGIATFNALKKSGAQAGDLVAIPGIGGLGHLTVQYARKMGFKVVAVGRGTDIARDTRMIGAHEYVDTNADDVVAQLTAMGAAQVILTTITNGHVVSDLISDLAPQGKLVVVGVNKDPLTVSTGQMVGGEE
jgi:alcohol dehydrogenase